MKVIEIKKWLMKVMEIKTWLMKAIEINMMDESYGN